MEFTSVVSGFVVGLVGSVLVQYLRRRHQLETTSKQATLDFIAKFEIHSPEWVDLSAAFWAAAKDPQEMKSLAPPRSSGDRRIKRTKIPTYLNHFEVVAIGVEQGIIHEELYSRWHRHNYLETWKACKPLVNKLNQSKKDGFHGVQEVSREMGGRIAMVDSS